MNRHVHEFYRETSSEYSKGHFHKVVALHATPDLDWNEIRLLAPELSRGWYELSRLKQEDRIEFVRDFWVSKLPYHPKLQEFITQFFNSVEDIGVFVVQKKYDDPHQAHMVYSLKNDVGFYRGYPPATDSGITNLQNAFSDTIFPQDYVAFLQIHDGFCKTTDCTGITQSFLMKESYEKFQKMVEAFETPLLTTKNQTVNPKTLIPFYESFGMPFYQCFWSEWYPLEEMGNVYFSGSTKTISDVASKDPSAETMAFPTYSDWLMFYLESIS